MSVPEALAHPVTGRAFPSPVPPGSGWPGEPADATTPVALGPDDAAALAAASHDLGDVGARVSVCRACPRLVAWREDVARAKRASFAGQPYWGRPVPSYGDPRPRLLIVGLAPAAHGANRTGRMFTGDRSGDVLFAALHRAGVAAVATSVAAGDGQELRGVRIAAPVHCAPPANAPTPGERAACAPWLDRELELVGPGLRAIMALGKIGWDATLGAVRRVGWAAPRGAAARFGHGAVVDLASPDGGAVRLVGCYHVSQQNTFTGRLTPRMLDEALAAALDVGAAGAPNMSTGGAGAPGD